MSPLDWYNSTNRIASDVVQNGSIPNFSWDGIIRLVCSYPEKEGHLYQEESESEGLQPACSNLTGLGPARLAEQQNQEVTTAACTGKKRQA